jgi:hypothetical protein
MGLPTLFLFRSFPSGTTLIDFDGGLTGLDHLRHRCCIICKTCEFMTFRALVPFVLPIIAISLVGIGLSFRLPWAPTPVSW